MMTEDLENELRSILARSGASIVIPEQARSRLLGRSYHPRRVSRTLATSLAAAAAAAGIALPLVAGTGSSHLASGAAITLAAHTFRMPAGYRLTAAASAPCRPFAITNLPPGHNGVGQQNPVGSQEMRAAASAAGGCIVLTLTAPYTPTAAAPDPYALSTAHPVQVGSYYGYLWLASVLVGQDTSGYLKPGWHAATNLDLHLPVGNGQVRDLVIGATGLTDHALIKIVASGLSS